jgi:hypothetical protein
VPFQCPGPPDQVGAIERWAEPGSLEKSCPSNAKAHLTKLEMQKGGLSWVALTTCALPMLGPARPRWRCHQVPVAV